MASKQTKKGKGTKTETSAALDPFAAVADQSAPSADRPKRAIKVIKAAKAVAKEPAARATASVPAAKPSKATVPVPANDAFAEVATAKAADDLNLEIPAVPAPAKRKKIAARSATSTVIERSKIKKKAASAKKAVKKGDTTVALPTSPALIAEAETLPDVTKEIAASEPAVELSPVFKKLSDVKLPELPRENRARLQMQSPTRLFFYWSLKQDPWQQLRAVFGPDLGSYTLVVKLRNITEDTEEIYPIETQGEWWFNDADADSEYMAEIGFYAVNRPYFRVLYSNTITTPRRAPSPHPAAEARWTVSATKFAEVLDASGFSRDAVDVAIAGDDNLDAEQRTNLAFSDLMTGAEYSTHGIAPEDMRHAMLALAGGTRLENLRHQVSASLFNVLQANAARLSTSGARRALTEHFDIEESEWTEHEFGSTVFGASLINFPKTIRNRTTKYSPRYNPVSSFSLGR